MENNNIFKSEEVDCVSFDDFERRIDYLEREVRKHRDSNPVGKCTPLLYRGQSDSAWELMTTLDRFSKSKVAVKEYYNDIKMLASEFGSLTGKEWDLRKTDFDNYLFSFRGKKEYNDMPMYEMMTYLRHNYFPSPLLDWTRSPYVAVFFAFNELYKKPDSGKVAIFVYLEHGESPAKIRFGGDSFIQSLGSNVRTHKRHFMQQSQYTICLEEDLEDPRILYYVKHEQVLHANNTNQDILKKFTLPFGEQLVVLERLNQMNINAYSLFGSEEALSHNLAVKTLLRNKGD